MWQAKFPPSALVSIIALAVLNSATAQAASEPDEDELDPTGEHAYSCGVRTTGTINVAPSPIRSGDTVTLTWTTVQPPGCNLPVRINGDLSPRQGSKNVSLLATTQYNLSVPARTIAQATAEVALCPAVDIRGNSHEWGRLLAQAVGTPNTLVRLWDDLNLDLTGFKSIRIQGGVTLTGFRRVPQVLPPAEPPAPIASLAALAPCREPRPDFVPARTGLDLGPRLFTRSTPRRLFLIHGDNVRLSNFRLHGPEFRHDPDRRSLETAIGIGDVVSVEIVNLELAGWSGQAIIVQDDPDQPRISGPEDVRIERNFFHHNQHAGRSGYGINVQDGAYALITRNVFDFNRHAIAASGAPEVGYRAQWNLVLKGGGRHAWYKNHTHQFDVHGDSNCIPIADAIVDFVTGSEEGHDGWPFGSLKNCGNAGERFWFIQNSFQYTRENDIQLRGRPRELSFIYSNVFPHSRPNAAISLHTRENVRIGSGAVANEFGIDSYGEYGVCDFDGDGRDDLFLATGVTWWYASAARMHWVFLNARRERLDRLAFGYFDDDRRCDVLTASGDRWEISSGGTSTPRPLPGAFPIPFGQLRFADFNADGRTDIFRRAPDGNWSVVSPGIHDWRDLASSSFQLDELRFGDFDGDRVTDVLSLANGHWSYSPGGAQGWRPLNPGLSTKLASLLIADINGNGIDDVVRFKESTPFRGSWQVSWDGRSDWETLKEVTSPAEIFPAVPTLTFAGRFLGSLRADLLHIDHRRIGRIFNTATSQLVDYNLYAY